jgi:hypothetical protein
MKSQRALTSRTSEVLSRAAATAAVLFAGTATASEALNAHIPLAAMRVIKILRIFVSSPLKLSVF